MGVGLSTIFRDYFSINKGRVGRLTAEILAAAWIFVAAGMYSAVSEYPLKRVLVFGLISTICVLGGVFLLFMLDAWGAARKLARERRMSIADYVQTAHYRDEGIKSLKRSRKWKASENSEM